MTIFNKKEEIIYSILNIYFEGLDYNQIIFKLNSSYSDFMFNNLDDILENGILIGRISKANSSFKITDLGKKHLHRLINLE